MNTASDNLEQIINFHQIDENIATSGQPSVEQFKTISQSAYEVVFNLALNDSPDAIEDENKIIRQLNMVYVHIPVEFESPRQQDLKLFFMHMEKYKNNKKFIHCVMNWRVSVFMFLYHTIEQGVAMIDARKHLDAVWQPDTVWQGFIQQTLNSYDIKT